MIRRKVLIDFSENMGLFSTTGRLIHPKIYIYANHSARSFYINLEDETMVDSGTGWGKYIPEVGGSLKKALKNPDRDIMGGSIVLNDVGRQLYYIVNYNNGYKFIKQNNSELYKRLRYEYFMSKVDIYGDFKKRFNEREKEYRREKNESS